MLHFEVSGSGYERGCRHGERFAALIREHAAHYQLGPEWDEEKEHLVTTIKENMADQVPDLYEEVLGIAQGAGLPVQDVLVLNYWIEVLQATEGFGCSLIGFAGTGDGAIVGKNSDHDLPAIRYLGQQRVRRRGGEEGFDFLRGTFVGTTSTRAGINSAGLALCGAALVPTETNWDGVPIMVLFDQILRRCATVDESTEMADRLAPINYGAHIMVADASGSLAVIERLPYRMVRREPIDGATFNTNHPLCTETSDYVEKGIALMKSSQERFDKLQELVPAASRTLSGLKQILRDHTEPGAICQHGAGGWYTCASYLLVPGRKKMLVAEGSACATVYEEYGLAYD